MFVPSLSRDLSALDDVLHGIGKNQKKIVDSASEARRAPAKIVNAGPLDSTWTNKRLVLRPSPLHHHGVHVWWLQLV